MRCVCHYIMSPLFIPSHHRHRRYPLPNPPSSKMTLPRRCQCTLRMLDMYTCADRRVIERLRVYGGMFLALLGEAAARTLSSVRPFVVLLTRTTPMGISNDISIICAILFGLASLITFLGLRHYIFCESHFNLYTARAAASADCQCFGA